MRFCPQDIPCNGSINDTVWNKLNTESSIVGWGSLAAFFASALFTISAIFIAYFTDSLTDGLMTDVDQTVISDWPKLRIPGRHPYWARIIRWLRSLSAVFKVHSDLDLKPGIPRAVRIEALQRFVLALSDQQLLTGNVLLISALTDSCNISLYEFDVVVTLAWFSTITHLASLTMLEKYFRTNYQLAVLRIPLMYVNLALLCYGLIIGDYAPPAPAQKSAHKFSQEVSLGCVLQAPRTFFKPNAITISAILLVMYLFTARVLNLTLVSHLHNWLAEELKPSSPRSLPSRSATNSSSRSYRDIEMLKDIPQHPFAMALQWAWSRIRYPRKHDRRSFERQLYISRVARHRRIEDRVYTILTRRPRRLYSPLRPRVFRYYVSRMSETFAAQVPALLFGLAYGVTQVLSLRIGAKLPDKAKDLDFGQLVAIFLLALPILAAAETYYESKHSTEITDTEVISASTASVDQRSVTTQAHAISPSPSVVRARHNVQQQLVLNTMLPTRSNVIMSAEEIDYRKKRHENTRILYQSDSGTIWVRIYLLLSVPLPIGLGIAFSRVRSPLILHGMAIFVIPIMNFADSLVTSVIELVRATRHYNAERSAPGQTQLNELSPAAHQVASNTFSSEPALRTASPQELRSEDGTLAGRRVMHHANTIAVPNRRRRMRAEDSEDSDLDIHSLRRSDTEGGLRYGHPERKQSKLMRMTLSTIPSHDAGSRPGGVIVREQEVGDNAASSSSAVLPKTGTLSRRTTGMENVQPK